MYLKNWELVHWRPKGGPIASVAVKAKLECSECHRENEFTMEGDALGADAEGAIRWIMTLLGAGQERCFGCGVTSMLPVEDRKRLEQEARSRITDDWLMNEKERLAPSPFSVR